MQHILATCGDGVECVNVLPDGSWSVPSTKGGDIDLNPGPKQEPLPEQAQASNQSSGFGAGHDVIVISDSEDDDNVPLAQVPAPHAVAPIKPPQPPAPKYSSNSRVESDAVELLRWLEES